MTNHMPEQAVHDKGKPPSMASARTRKLPWFKHDPDDWDNETLGMSLELQGFYTNCLNALWRLGGVLVKDVAKIALLTRCHVRIVRRLLPQLVALGKLADTAEGYVSARLMAEIAAANKPKERRVHAPAVPDRQLSFDNLVPGESGKSSTPEAKNPEVSTRALDPDPDLESESEREDTPLPPEPARPPDKAEPVHRLVLGGMGQGGVVSSEARRRVCARLAIGNADPLVALYDAWPLSQSARDPDGLFIAVAPRLFREAAPEVRQACQPLGASEASPAPLPPVRPSAALLAKLSREGRHGIHAH